MKLWLFLFTYSVALNTEYVAMEIMCLIIYNKTFSGNYKYFLQDADITRYKTRAVVFCYTLVSDFYVDM